VKRIDLLGSIPSRKRKFETRDQENQGNREHGCSWSGSGWHSSAARIVTFRRKLRAGTDSQELDQAQRIFPSRRLAKVKPGHLVVSESTRIGRGKPVCRDRSHFTSKRLRNLGRGFVERQTRVRRSTAIGVSEKARGIPHRISKRIFWRCRSNEKLISKVSNHRKNKGFELLPGLEPWAVPAARQETSDMGFMLR